MNDSFPRRTKDRWLCLPLTFAVAVERTPVDHLRLLAAQQCPRIAPPSASGDRVARHPWKVYRRYPASAGSEASRFPVATKELSGQFCP